MYSVLNYIGKKEVELLEDMKILQINTYCEPFAGSFNTGFKLIEQHYDAKYILNDLDYNIYNFWNQLKHRYTFLNVKVKQMLDEISRLERRYPNRDTTKLVERYLELKLKSDKDTERAAAEFIYRQSKTVHGFRYRRGKIHDLLLLDFYLDYEYLQKVKVFNKDYKEILAKYDSKDTFFFIDPPYKMAGVNKYYRCDSHKFNHKKLYNLVRKLEGKWLLTYNYDETIMEWYKDYNIEIVERNLYGNTYKEMYIRNYKI